MRAGAALCNRHSEALLGLRQFQAYAGRNNCFGTRRARHRGAAPYGRRQVNHLSGAGSYAPGAYRGGNSTHIPDERPARQPAAPQRQGGMPAFGNDTLRNRLRLRTLPPGSYKTALRGTRAHLHRPLYGHARHRRHKSVRY